MPIKQKYCFALLATVGIAGAATVADTYVSGIENLVASHRSQTTRLNAPANLTANALLAGGHIFLASNDSSFFYEGSGRSGGIMQMLQYLSQATFIPAMWPGSVIRLVRISQRSPLFPRLNRPELK